MRMTREERRAHTRSSLMAAAGRGFSSQGLQRASIDQVAEEAGFTKGAFYANFASKEELFLAMLEERFAGRLAEIEDQAGADVTRYLRADPEWERLFFEFAAYSARNEEFRGELVARYRTLREALVAGFGRWCEEHGVEPPLPLDRIVLMTCAMANGFALEQMLEPDAVADDVYASLLDV